MIDILDAIFLELLYEKITLPLLKFIGSVIRWIFTFWKFSYSEIKEKEYNSLIGGIIVLTPILYFLIKFDLF